MLLDTNIIIAALDGEESIVSSLLGWRKEGRLLIVSSISVAEVLAFPAIQPDELQIAKEFMREFLVVSFDQALAELAAEFERSRGLALPDAAIVATAMANHVPLVTRDKKLLKIKDIITIKL